MKILGIPVQIKLSFFVVAVALGLGRGSDATLLIEWVVVVFFSVLLHEFGHALAARAFGLSPSVELYAMGGLTWWAANQRGVSPLIRILISVAGPFAGVCAGIATLILGVIIKVEGGLAKHFIDDAVWVNLGWGALNLLPMLPLDGGNVMRSLEEWITGRRDATASRIISLLFALGVASIGMIGWLWISILGTWFAFSNGASLLQDMKERGDQQLRSALNRGWDAARREDGPDAVRVADEILNMARSDRVRREAMELLVYGYLQQSDLQKAREKYGLLQALYGRDPYLEGFLLLSGGETDRALAVLEPAFRAQPVSRIGHLLGQALIRARRFEEALELCRNRNLAQYASALSQEVESEAFRAGEYRSAARAGELLFSQSGDPSVAYKVGCALARAGHPEESLNWLRKAIQAGFSDRTLLSTDPDLETVRGLAGFDQLGKSV